MAEQIQLAYTGLPWDGTLEGAEAICEAILWVLPRYQLERSYGTRWGKERRLTIVQGLSSALPSFEMRKGDMLACERNDEGRLRPEKVVTAEELGSQEIASRSGE